jgi:hypothetical protein
MVKITKDIYDKMVEMRTSGAVYSEIMRECNVSKWACINYLKEITMKNCWISEEWQKVENEAEDILKSMGFDHIINLNKICNVAPYWDYCGEEVNEKWLIDVTINTQKSLVEKQSRSVEGYVLGILYKNTTEWKLLKISAETIFVKPVQ